MASMGTKRMFVALRPPAELVAELEDFVEATGIARTGVRLVNPAKWHITLSFMPAVQSVLVDALRDELSSLATNTRPLELVLRGAGLFPRPGASTPIWIGVDGDLPGLDNLALRVRAACQRSGARVDSPKRFKPHMTLSRQRPTDHWELWIERLNQFHGSDWLVTEVLLIETTMGGRGHPARHDVVGRHPLSG